MINKSYRAHIQDISSISSSSPISFASRAFSPGIKPHQQLPPRSRQYKSPNSTPTTSPIPSKVLSMEEFSQCFSEKKNNKDSIYYFKQKIIMQDRRIQVLEEENKKLSQMKVPENWEKELIKRNDDMRKLENQLKYYKELAAERTDNDRLLDTIVEKDNKIAKLESELLEYKQKFEDLDRNILTFKKDNKMLLESMESHKKCLKRDECEMLLNQIQELEINLEVQARDNKLLKEENLKFKNELSSGSLVYFSQDINKIRREMSKLVKVLEDVAHGKEITLKGLLGIDNEWKSDPVQQLSADILSIKHDLNKVLGMISDMHAEQCANFVCKNQ